MIPNHPDIYVAINLSQYLRKLTVDCLSQTIPMLFKRNKTQWLMCNTFTKATV